MFHSPFIHISFFVSRDCPQGGVSILVRHGLLARQAKPQASAPEGDVVMELWHSTRWCHVLVCSGTGAVTLHMGSLPSRRSTDHSMGARA